MPRPTQESRQLLAKHVKMLAEAAKTAVRGVRQRAMKVAKGETSKVLTYLITYVRTYLASHERRRGRVFQGQSGWVGGQDGWAASKGAFQGGLNRTLTLTLTLTPPPRTSVPSN